MGIHKRTITPEQLDRETKVLELRRAGFTWAQVAEKTGYADHTGAMAAFRRVCERLLQPPTQDLIRQELDRLDRLQLAAWNNAMRGDVASIHVILRAMERRAKYLGLDSAVKIEHEVTTWQGGDSIDSAVRELAKLLEENDAFGASTSPMDGDMGEAESTTTEARLGDLADTDGPRLGED